MVTAYYSTVLDQPLSKVWSVIRDFNNYPVYIEGVTESFIEDGKAGDEVGAVRRFVYAGTSIRQRLGAHSDEGHSLTYIGIDPFSAPEGMPLQPTRYEGTMHLLPVTDGDRSFLEWSVDLDTARGDEAAWLSLFMSMIPEWADSLKRTMASRT